MVNLRWVSTRWRGGPAWYLPVALTLFVGSLLPALQSHGTRFGGLPDRPYDALAVAGIALQCVPLVVCHRWPVAGHRTSGAHALALPDVVVESP